MESLFTSDGFWKLGVLVVILLGALYGLVRSARFGLVFLGAMLFISSLGLPNDVEKGAEYRTWLFALQERRQLAYLACGALLFMSAFVHAGKLNTKNIPGLGIGLGILGVYMGLVSIFHDGPIGGFLAVFLAVFSIGGMLLVISSSMSTWDDFVAILRTISLTGIALTMACTVQFLLDQNMLLTGVGRRFVGLSGNPQHAAGLSAVVATVGIWLVLNDRTKFWKLLAMLATASHIVFVLWTGSRTGLALTIIGFTSVFYARIGRSVIYAPIVGAIGLGLLNLAESMGVKFGFDRLVSTDDTRSGKWMTMWEQGVSSPLIGVGLGDAGGSENGFLYGFASYGLGVPILQFILMLASIGVCLRLIKSRFETNNPIAKRLIDITIGFLAMYWAGNLFEGFGIARISPQLVFFLIFACMAATAITLARQDYINSQSQPEGSDGADENAVANDGYGGQDGYGGEYGGYGQIAGYGDGSRYDDGGYSNPQSVPQSASQTNSQLGPLSGPTPPAGHTSPA